MRISDWSSDVCSSDLLPTDEAALLRHYILADDDLIHIDRRRRPENRIGFALQLCALRYPGRTLAPGELIPHTVSAFLGAQLGDQFAGRSEEHTSELQSLMRISYAVFCLKKKNKITYQRAI